jgi:hypothetical protein
LKDDFYLDASYTIYKHGIKEIPISLNGQQSTEYLVKYLDTTVLAIKKLLSLIRKSYDIVQKSSVKEREDEKKSD